VLSSCHGPPPPGRWGHLRDHGDIADARGWSHLRWAAASLLILFGGWIAPNTVGSIFVIAQALVVAALALLEHGALRATFPKPRTA
jgi:hypothetical protein